MGPAWAASSRRLVPDPPSLAPPAAPLPWWLLVATSPQLFLSLACLHKPEIRPGSFPTCVQARTRLATLSSQTNSYVPVTFVF